MADTVGWLEDLYGIPNFAGNNSIVQHDYFHNTPGIRCMDCQKALAEMTRVNSLCEVVCM
jgi:hypothetical protein